MYVDNYYIPADPAAAAASQASKEEVDMRSIYVGNVSTNTNFSLAKSTVDLLYFCLGEYNFNDLCLLNLFSCLDDFGSMKNSVHS